MSKSVLTFDHCRPQIHDLYLADFLSGKDEVNHILIGYLSRIAEAILPARISHFLPTRTRFLQAT